MTSAAQTKPRAQPSGLLPLEQRNLQAPTRSPFQQKCSFHHNQKRRLKAHLPTGDMPASFDRLSRLLLGPAFFFSNPTLSFQVVFQIRRAKKQAQSIFPENLDHLIRRRRLRQYRNLGPHRPRNQPGFFPIEPATGHPGVTD